MSYTSNSNLASPIHQRERELLLAGRSYAEVAAALGVKHGSVAERNRLVYGVNLRNAFAERIEREGIPVRLSVSDEFGYWFSGFFDGEGCLSVFSRPRTDRYFERRLGVQIMLRDDDGHVVDYIKDKIGIGLAYRSPGRFTTNPKATYRCEAIKDLAEVFIPLFDKYPLHTKKGREYAIWRKLVIFQYTVTLGGYSQRAACTEEDNAFFDSLLQQIRDIRTYPGSVGIAQIEE